MKEGSEFFYRELWHTNNLPCLIPKSKSKSKVCFHLLLKNTNQSPLILLFDNLLLLSTPFCNFILLLGFIGMKDENLNSFSPSHLTPYSFFSSSFFLFLYLCSYPVRFNPVSHGGYMESHSLCATLFHGDIPHCDPIQIQLHAHSTH